MTEINLITISTHDIDQINGINALNYSIKRYNKSFEKIRVLTPTYVNKLHPIEFINEFVDIGESTEDKYFAKFVLPEYCKDLKPDSVLFYLDPDHICFGEILLPQIEDNHIWVSSEYYSLINLIDETELEQVLSTKFKSIDISRINHCNTSIILCTVKTLNKIASTWENVYKELFNVISHRHLEEVSFSIAGKICGITIEPIETHFQSSFFKSSERCALFHYGGRAEKSKFLKSKLNEAIDLVLPNIEQSIVEIIRQDENTKFN